MVPADGASSGVRSAATADTIDTAGDTGGMPVRFRMGSADEHILRYRACHARSVRKNAARRVRHNARSHWAGHSMTAPVGVAQRDRRLRVDLWDQARELTAVRTCVPAHRIDESPIRLHEMRHDAAGRVLGTMNRDRHRERCGDKRFRFTLRTGLRRLSCQHFGERGFVRRTGVGKLELAFADTEELRFHCFRFAFGLFDELANELTRHRGDESSDAGNHTYNRTREGWSKSLCQRRDRPPQALRELP